MLVLYVINYLRGTLHTEAEVFVYIGSHYTKSISDFIQGFTLFGASYLESKDVLRWKNCLCCINTRKEGQKSA